MCGLYSTVDSDNGQGQSECEMTLNDDMSKASGTIKQRSNSLDTFSEASRPKLTPASIVWKSTIATLVWFFWLLVLISFIIGMIVITVQSDW